MTWNEHGIDENNLLEGERVLWENDDWRVTNFVFEEVPGRGGYWIGKRDLHDRMWPDHMATKKWVNHSSFMEALEKARDLHPRGEAA